MIPNSFSHKRYLGIRIPESLRLIARCRPMLISPTRGAMGLAAAGLFLCALAAEAAEPTVSDALRIEPTQRRVEIDHPSVEQSSACTISVKRDNGLVGWLIQSSAGVPLRWFVDTNGDNVLDRWSYYKDGLEVYRDIDTDFNGQVDQCRWFHSAGTRWGVDPDEDGVIDQWKSISVEELSEEVVDALARNDATILRPFVLSSSDIASLKLGSALQDRLLKEREELSAAISAMPNSQPKIPKGAKWVVFQGSRPGLIPVATAGTEHGIRVREKAMAIVQKGGELIQLDLGPLIQIGDAWRMVQTPRVISEAAAGQASRSEFFFPSDAVPMAGTVASEGTDYQELLSQLAAVDQDVAGSAPESSPAAAARRADLLGQLAASAPDPAERAMWTRQLADTLLAAVQSGEFPDGLTRLHTIVKRLEKQPHQKELAAYVSFRYLTATYTASLQSSGADHQRVHEERQKSLKQFVETYADSEDAAEAMLQLGLSEEFADHKEKAAEWYRRVVQRFGTTSPAQKATGAIRRLESVGEHVSFRGRSLAGAMLDLDDYRGKIVLLHYWATWSPPSTEQMSALAGLAKQHGSNGLVVIGVNVDGRQQDASAYLAGHPVSWPQIHEPGGMDSPPANQFGVFTAPTLILIDRDGKLVKHSSALLEIEGWIRERIRETNP